MYGSGSGFYVIGPDADVMYLNLGSNFTKWVRVRIFLSSPRPDSDITNSRKGRLNRYTFLPHRRTRRCDQVKRDNWKQKIVYIKSKI